MTILTDDEIVGVVAQLGSAWPFPLPTVPLDELVPAATRGARSLLVRELAHVIDDALVIDESIEALVREIVGSSERRVAYVAFDGTPVTLAGSSTFLYGVAGESSIADLVSAGGIHVLNRVGADDGVELFIAAVLNAFRLGIRGVPDSSRPAALFALSPEAPSRNAVRISKGELAFGRFEGGGDGSHVYFVGEASSTDWDPERVLELTTASGS